MGKSTPPKDFKIHVDQSCLTDSTDLEMTSSQRITSDQTVVHRDSWSEESPKTDEKDTVKEPDANEPTDDTEEILENDPPKTEEKLPPHQQKLDPRIEAQIQAAARRVVADLERTKYDGKDDSVLSAQSDESYDKEGTELTYNGTELTHSTDRSYEDGTELTYDGTDVTYESESERSQHDKEEIVDDLENEIDSQLELLEASHHSENEQPDLELDAVEGSDVEEDTQNHESEPTHVLDKEDDGHNAELETVYDLENEEAHDHQSVALYEANDEHSDVDQGGDSSSHHDGDISDDVFSRNSGHSARSSLNSCHDLLSSDEAYNQKALTSPAVGEDASSVHESTISRIPSGASYTPLDESKHRTPSKVLSRPPFRTPSSVRAMQMTSPTPSFSSPRSSKRHMPTVSRIGTPTSQFSPTKRTPTRFKKKEQPLVLLHVTVLPLQWQYSHLMPSSEVPEVLYNVRENWRLLQDKVGDTVLERGILLPHPQDSYEVLEERLLEALELPVRPRARILKCGHYMGPDDETPSSDDEAADEYFHRESMVSDKKWCDICGRDIRYEDGGNIDRDSKRRFRVKIYASNGLMRAGAWAAAWKEMERVDVEIEPFIEVGLHDDLEHLASVCALKPDVAEREAQAALDDGFVDEEDALIEHVHEQDLQDHDLQKEKAELEEEQRLIEANEQRRAEEEELHRKMEEEELAHRLIEEEQQRKLMEEDIRREILEDQRLQEVYGQDHHSRSQSHVSHNSHVSQPRMRHDRRASSRPGKRGIDEDSFLELLGAAFKVAMRDKRNLVIVALSMLVLVLALRPGGLSKISSQVLITENTQMPEVLGRIPERASKMIASVPDSAEVVRDIPSKIAEVASKVTSEVVAETAEAVQIDTKSEPEPEIEQPLFDSQETKDNPQTEEAETIVIEDQPLMTNEGAFTIDELPDEVTPVTEEVTIKESLAIEEPGKEAVSEIVEPVSEIMEPKLERPLAEHQADQPIEEPATASIRLQVEEEL